MTKPSSFLTFRPDLTPLEGREVPAALVQVIHNSPFAAAAKVDVYINNTLPAATTGVAFRSATPFLTVDNSNPVFVSIRPAGASVASPPIFNQSFTLADNSKSILIATGDPGAASTALTKFQLLATTSARTTAATVGNVEFLVVHGSPDAPPVDVKARGVGTLVNDIAYPSIDSKYLSVAPANYTLDVTLADGVSRVGSFAANLTGAANKAITVLASGFAGALPAGTNAANTFGLLAVNADGTSSLLPKAAANPLRTSFAAGAANNLPAEFDFSGKLTSSSGGNNTTTNVFERVAIGDLDGDGKTAVVTGSGPGAPNSVQYTFSKADGAIGSVIFSPFEASFTGGVFVTTGDIDGDGKDELIVTPDQGGGPVVAIYSGAKLAQGLQGDAAQLTRFFGIEDTAFRGGARASVGDVNGDGTPDVVVAAGFGGGPRLALFNGKSVLTPPAAGKFPPKLVGDFFVFEDSLRNGVFVGVGDVNADGSGDIIVGGGPGGGPRVQAISGKDLVAAASKQTTLGNFFVGDPANRDGVRLVAKDLDGDANADLVVGLGSAGTPQVRGFAGKDFAASVTGKAPTPIAGLDLNAFINPGVVYVG